MKDLSLTEKYAVMHCVYQLIASADGSVDEERDAEAIEYVLTLLNLQSIHMWDSALRLNPYDCFAHVASMEAGYKVSFSELLFVVAGLGGNGELRNVCARHLLKLCSIDHESL